MQKDEIQIFEVKYGKTRVNYRTKLGSCQVKFGALSDSKISERIAPLSRLGDKIPLCLAEKRNKSFLAGRYVMRTSQPASCLCFLAEHNAPRNVIQGIPVQKFLT
jgi:hypothetical protein